MRQATFEILSEFTPYKGFVFDLDGTVYLGERLIPGAAETIAALREHDRKVVFLSNKPLEQRFAYAEKLSHLGIPASTDDVINSSYVLARYLARTSPGARVFCTGEPPLLQELAEHKLQVLSEEEAVAGPVDIVIAAFDRTLTYAKLNAAFQALLAGARFVATNGDRTCPVDGGSLPDAAGVIAFLEATSDRQVELIAGKPNALMLEVAAERLGVPVKECLMVGDRLETDMRMGMEAGMGTAAVLSGVATIADVEEFRQQVANGSAPKHVLPSIAAICQSNV